MCIVLVKTTPKFILEFWGDPNVGDQLLTAFDEVIGNNLRNSKTTDKPKIKRRKKSSEC